MRRGPGICEMILKSPTPLESQRGEKRWKNKKIRTENFMSLLKD